MKWQQYSNKSQPKATSIHRAFSRVSCNHGHVADQSESEAPLKILSGPWDIAQIERFLNGTVIPVRLATAGEWPMVQSMWFRYATGQLWCATQRNSVLVARLRRQSHCGFEVAGDQPPYRGVRGFGTARIAPAVGEQTLMELLDRYLKDDNRGLRDWLLKRADDEVAVILENLSVSTWDFSGRMSPRA